MFAFSKWILSCIFIYLNYIIYLSKFVVEDDDTKAQTSNTGMDGIISKPVKPVELKKHLWYIISLISFSYRKIYFAFSNAFYNLL